MCSDVYRMLLTCDGTLHKVLELEVSGGWQQSVALVPGGKRARDMTGQSDICPLLIIGTFSKKRRIKVRRFSQPFARIKGKKSSGNK